MLNFFNTEKGQEYLFVIALVIIAAGVLWGIVYKPLWVCAVVLAIAALYFGAKGIVFVSGVVNDYLGGNHGK